MKKYITLILSVFGLFFGLKAHPVDQKAAHAIAVKFMGTERVGLTSVYKTTQNDAALYVFNTDNGFVIISGDDCETPIISYSHEGRFDPENLPVQLEGFLQDFVARIQYGIEHRIVAGEVTSRQWEQIKATGRIGSETAESAGPLLTEKWKQGCLYNSACPLIESAPCGHARAGCVAVAMGQIMHYWGYPSTGWGSHSYFDGSDTLSVDFGDAIYEWNLMPDSLTDLSTSAEIDAVATLLYHCGVSVDMYYNASSSSAYAYDVPGAIYRYFSYSRLVHSETQSDYSNEEWLSLLRNQLDLRRPVLYSGSGNHGGHAFVCDGYDVNGLLHFNWGWGGSCDGFFALGNLNPEGSTFNRNNQAVIDIVPQYDPCQVLVTVHPSTGGIIEGAGEYHIGEQCTLTATPADNYDLFCWKLNGEIVSNALSVTLPVEADTLNIEVLFSCFHADRVTSDYVPDPSHPDNQNMSLSWSHDDPGWVLLKQFGVNGETAGLATDGEHIYVTYAGWNDPPFMFEKYTMDGDLVDAFNLEGVSDAFCLAYDGTDFYCNSLATPYLLEILYRIDIENKTVIDSVDMPTWFAFSTYDAQTDGFWLGKDYHVILYNRQGQRIKSTPKTPDYLFGAGYLIAPNGKPHLLLLKEHGVYDYDIDDDIIYDRPLLLLGEDENPGYGTFAGKYDDKDALYFFVDSTVCIYEIKNVYGQDAPIAHYRIYRSGSEGETEMLADGVVATSYIDTAWHDLEAGLYRFGVSEVLSNGVESEPVWSDFIVKQNIGVEEYEHLFDQSVQKLFKDGQVIILKDGRRYNVIGQEIK